MSIADLESTIETKTSQYASSLGMMVLKLNVKGQAGWPDRLYVWQGRVMFIEFKAARQKPRPLQEAVMRNLRHQGMLVHVVDNLIDGRTRVNEFYNLPPVCA